MKKLIKEPTLKCASCEEIKPRAQFFKRLSLAQTAAMLGKPRAKTRTTVISKNCKDCQHSLKSHKALTKKQIQNKINSGDMHRVLGELKKAEIDRAIPEKRRRAIKIRWQKHHNKERKELNDALQKEVTRARNKYHAYKSYIQKQDRNLSEESQEGAKINQQDYLAVLLAQYRNLQNQKNERLQEYDERKQK